MSFSSLLGWKYCVAFQKRGLGCDSKAANKTLRLSMKGKVLGDLESGVSESTLHWQKILPEVNISRMRSSIFSIVALSHSGATKASAGR
jgi:hypothetical protein